MMGRDGERHGEKSNLSPPHSTPLPSLAFIDIFERLSLWHWDSSWAFLEKQSLPLSLFFNPKLSYRNDLGGDKRYRNRLLALNESATQGVLTYWKAKKNGIRQKG